MSLLDGRGRGCSTTLEAGVAGSAQSRREALTPSSAIPIAYFAFAHVCLAAGLGALAANPGLAGVSFYHPKMIALVHLLTLGWISGSILGAFYVVAPLALAIRMPPPGWRDWGAFAAFACGTAGMVAHFWMGMYDGMALSAVLVLAGFVSVGGRGCHSVGGPHLPFGVGLHIRLAFFNILAAGIFGIVIGLDRTRGFLGLAPVAATYAHAHLAALGWAVMMVMGLSYRLIPMMLPSAMPSGRSLAASAVLLEAGLALLVLSVFSGWPLVPLAGVLILGGLAAFVLQIMRTAVRRLPRPPALPRRDWSIWQVHAAFIWLLVASILGFTLSRADASPDVGRAWFYGTAGLVGFLAQIIVGMHGRLVPYYAWYRVMAASGGRTRRGANALPSAGFARAVFLTWLAGVPLLAWGLASINTAAISTAALLLLAGVSVHAAHLVYMLWQAGAPIPANHALRRTGITIADPPPLEETTAR